VDFPVAPDGAAFDFRPRLTGWRDFSYLLRRAASSGLAAFQIDTQLFNPRTWSMKMRTPFLLSFIHSVTSGFIRRTEGVAP
jgi:hypothetical protein